MLQIGRKAKRRADHDSIQSPHVNTSNSRARCQVQPQTIRPMESSSQQELFVRDCARAGLQMLAKAHW